MYPKTNVTKLPIRSNAPLQSGITYDQAMEILDRFCSRLEAAPTVAYRMNVGFNTVAGVLDGKVWPQARQYWLDHAVAVT